MTDIASISAILSSIKTATDLARLLKDSKASLERAEVKLKLADLIGALADARIELSELQTLVLEKDKRIDELKLKLRDSGNTVGYLGARYLADEDGEPFGGPFCPTCFAKSKELYPLTNWSPGTDTHKCGNCGNTITDRASPLDVEQYIQRNKQAAEKLGNIFEVRTFP